jgi:hypothetical protein
MNAMFDKNDHAIWAGWATYMKPLHRARQRLCGRIFGHVVPFDPPIPADGYSPSNYDNCERCGAAIKWYVVGQHRYGSLGRRVAS